MASNLEYLLIPFSNTQPCCLPFCSCNAHNSASSPLQELPTLCLPFHKTIHAHSKMYKTNSSRLSSRTIPSVLLPTSRLVLYESPHTHKQIQLQNHLKGKLLLQVLHRGTTLGGVVPQNPPLIPSAQDQTGTAESSRASVTAPGLLSAP